MESRNEKIIYKVDVLEKQPEFVEIEVKQVAREQEPLLHLDNLDQNYLLQGGKHVFQSLRDFAFGPEPLTPRTDDTYEERDPFSGPIKRTQLPVYPEDMQRYREEATHKQDVVEFVTPRVIAETVNQALEQVPDTKTIQAEINTGISTFTDWITETCDSFMAPPNPVTLNDEDQIN